ncbi:MAG: SpoIIE family protein phosphatase [Planctomycetes bacterium]|nr:SpoIIE family protein phosphatase [Planctomycetota bacterium]
MAILRYLDDAGRLQTRTMDAEHFVIGRADSCQLTFADDMISREHVRIDLEREGRFRIRDLGSRNKTYVNGELITETLLTSGDIIRVGDHVLEYLDDSTDSEKIDLDFLSPDRKEPPHCDWIKAKAPLSLTVAQIEQLSQLLGDQPLTARLEDIAGAALGQIIMDLQGERGLVALRGEEKMALLPLAHRGLKKPPGGSLVPVSQSFLYAPILQGAAGRYPQTAGQLKMTLGYAATAIVTPLSYRGDVIGLLYVDRPVSKKPFPSSALQYAAAAGAHVGAQIAESSRKLARSAVREGAAWMTTIRRVQTALTTSVQSSDAFDVAFKCHPGRARCGDFADVLHIDEQRCCALVIDGGGHGMSGITQASAIRTAIRAALSVSDDGLMDPAEIFNSINQMMAQLPSRQILPCTYVGIDMYAGKLAYINAGGMPPLLMVGAGRLVTLDQPALVLGVDPDYLYEVTRVDLPESYRVICHTDGLTEAGSSSGEPMGDQRLHEILLDRDAFVAAEEILAKIGNAWTTHLAGAQPDDDALVLVIARG